MIVPSTLFLKRLLDAARNNTVGGNFDGPMVTTYFFLFTNRVLITQETLMSDLVEASFDTYQRYQVFYVPFWNYLSADGNWSHVDNGYEWGIMTGANNPQNVWGWGVVDAPTGGNLLFAELLDEPVPMTFVNAAFVLEAVTEYGPGLFTGGAIIRG